MAFVYTEQEFDQIKSLYAQGTELETLAQQFNKSVASVRMKLVKAGLYQKVTKPTKAATKEPKAATTTIGTLMQGTMTKAKHALLVKEFNLLYRDYGPALM